MKRFNNKQKKKKNKENKSKDKNPLINYEIIEEINMNHEKTKETEIENIKNETDKLEIIGANIKEFLSNSQSQYTEISDKEDISDINDDYIDSENIKDYLNQDSEKFNNYNKYIGVDGDHYRGIILNLKIGNTKLINNKDYYYDNLNVYIEPIDNTINL